MPKFGPDPSARLKDIAEKQLPAKLKPIVVSRQMLRAESRQHAVNMIRVSDENKECIEVIPAIVDIGNELLAVSVVLSPVCHSSLTKSIPKV